MQSISSITIAWSNERWLRVTQGRNWDDMLDHSTQNRLQHWIEDDEEEETVFFLETRDPGVVLYLSKTILPLTPPSTTHAFCIITSQADSGRSPYTPSDLSSPGLRSSISEVRSSFSQMQMSTSSNPRTSISTDTSKASGSTEYFPTMGGPRRTRKKDAALSIQHMISAADEYWQMLEAFDWSKTKLGPRETWAESIGPLLSVTFQSKSMDCIWLGEDLHLI